MAALAGAGYDPVMNVDPMSSSPLDFDPDDTAAYALVSADTVSYEERSSTRGADTCWECGGSLASHVGPCDERNR